MKNEMNILLDIYELIDEIWYFLLLFTIFFIIKTVRSLLTDFKNRRIHNYSRIIKKYFLNKRFHELLEFCKSKEKVDGFHGHSLWWQGKAYIELSQFSKAKELFLRVEKEYPHWKSSSINPYLNFIKEKRINKN